MRRRRSPPARPTCAVRSRWSSGARATGSRRRCDFFVRLPMRGAIGSLNAAVAGSILLFEVIGQRGPGSESARPNASRTEEVAVAVSSAPESPVPAPAKRARKSKAKAAAPTERQPIPETGVEMPAKAPRKRRIKAPEEAAKEASKPAADPAESPPEADAGLLPP